MSKKTTSGKAGAQPPLRDNLKDSAQQIWLAGLGAFNKAQEEGGKMFDALVQEGLSMQRRAQSAAEEKIAEAGQKMNTMAQDFGTKAAGQWDRLESLFEDRVARALRRLGMPTAADMHALARRLETLEKPAGSAARKAPAKKKSAAKKVATKKPVTKKAPARKAPATKRPAARKPAA